MLEIVSQQTRQLEAFRADVARVCLKSRKLCRAGGSTTITAARSSKKSRGWTNITRRARKRRILRDKAREIADFCGEEAVLLEYGAGAGIKTEILIDALDGPRLYVPIDIAGDFLDETVVRLRRRFPDLETLPVVADFTCDFDIPGSVPRARRKAFFPGSTIGNLDPQQTKLFLRRVRRHVGSRGAAIIGVDLKKDIETLLAAYDDREGVTAAFNLNLLTRINRELGADFSPKCFAHQARWNVAECAIEMHLVSLREQVVTVDGRRFAFDRRGNNSHGELPEIRHRQLHGSRRERGVVCERNLDRLRPSLRCVRPDAM